jgi:RNA polymerase sigma-70 factor (sigma-E family)
MGFRWISGRRERDDEFVAYYEARGDALRKTAYLLCGDWHLAEDLTQTTFIKLYRSWHRIARHDVLDQYARRVLLRAYLDERRRPWRREFATVPDSAALDAVARDDRCADERMVLRSALAGLTPRHRAVLVLRFWLDLSVEQTADVLGCSSGTVKSQTSRGLAGLREALGGTLVDLQRTTRGGQS